MLVYDYHINNQLKQITQNDHSPISIYVYQFLNDPALRGYDHME